MVLDFFIYLAVKKTNKTYRADACRTRGKSHKINAESTFLSEKYLTITTGFNGKFAVSMGKQEVFSVCSARKTFLCTTVEETYTSAAECGDLAQCKPLQTTADTPNHWRSLFLLKSRLYYVLIKLTPTGLVNNWKSKQTGFL